MPLLSSHFKQAEFSREVWRVIPPADITLAEMLKPSYWAHVAKALLPGAIIEVAPADMSWYAELYVRAVGATEATVAVLRQVDFSAKAAEASPDVNEFEVKFSGGAKWRVIRKSDRSVLAENLQTREAADAWLADHKHAQEALA